MDILGLILLVVLLVVGGRWLWSRQPKKVERSHIKALMMQCHGDQDLVERLIFAEMERTPHISMGEASVRARKRLLSDLR